MSKEILVVLNRKSGSVKAQLTQIKDFINSTDEKDKTKLESKMDTLKSLRIKLSDIRNEYYEVVVKDSDLEPLELEILDLEDDCEDIQAAQHNDFLVFLNLTSDHSSFAHRWKELTTKNGDTVVHLAAHSGCVKIIKFYADYGNKIILESKNNDGKTPLHIASHSSQLECVKFLLSCGVSVNALKRSDWTPLMLACTKSNLDIVTELLLHGADLNILNKDGWTAFHIASREGNPEIIKCLLDFNASVWKTKSKNGRTPLHTAALHGHLDIVKIFFENTKYDINVKDSCGITPIMDAASGNHNHVVKFFIENGASLMEEDKLGRNLLHLAAEAGNLECIRWFVKIHNMSIDSQTLQGLSPLHFACKENNIDTFNLLLQLGANCNLKDKRGRSALEYASIKEIPNCMMYLSKK